MDSTRKAREIVTEKRYTMSYNTKNDQNIDNVSNDKRYRHFTMTSGDSGSYSPRLGTYVTDYWEKSPKTDYTYAHSASYNRNYEEQYVNPNMSRPSLRQSDDSINHSDCTDTSSHSIKYHLRSRDVLDNLLPMRDNTTSWLIAQNAGGSMPPVVATHVAHHHKKSLVTMVDKNNSPMVASNKMLTHIYGTDGVSSTKSGPKESRNRFLSTLTYLWMIVTFPFSFVKRMMTSTNDNNVDKRKRMTTTMTTTKRSRELRNYGGQSEGGFNYESGDVDDVVGEANSNHENRSYRITNFFCYLIGTIGGIFNVLRKIFGSIMMSSSAVDGSLLNRSNQAHRQHICCVPLIVLVTAAILGGGYLYACGNSPNYDQVYKYKDMTVNVLHEYSVYCMDASGYLWTYLTNGDEEDSKPATTPEDLTPSSTPHHLPTVSTTRTPDFDFATPQPSCPEGTPMVQMKQLDDRLNELKINLETNLHNKWVAYETQFKTKQDGDLSVLKSLKSDFHSFKLEFNDKVERLKDSMERERLERTTLDLERSNAEEENFEKLRVDFEDSLDRFKVQLERRVEVNQREVEGRLDALGDVSGDREDGNRRSIEMHLHEIFSSTEDSELRNSLLVLLSDRYVTIDELERRVQSTVEKLTLELKSIHDADVALKVQESTDKLREDLMITLEDARKQLHHQVEVVHGRSTSSDHGSKVTHEDVKLLIKNALSVYDADKTGKTDYALESAGGSVLGTRCSKTYKKGMAQLSVFGIPLWYANNSPRTVIQPGSLPGECWPFVGSIGFMVVQLSTRIHVTEVSLEHVNINITTFGLVDSAPKEFAVWGLSDSNDHEGINLGDFTYEAHGEPIQFFPIAIEQQRRSFLHVELRVYSNHGSKEYTCLYRFRVHGTPDFGSHDDNAGGH